MLYYEIQHPGILASLSKSGHGSMILIADGNYPFATKVGRNAEKVYLNYSRDILDVISVLQGLVQAVPIESADVMVPDDGTEPKIFEEFRNLLPIKISKYKRFEFYDKAMDPHVSLLIATGESRIFSNILLTIGVA